MDRIKKSFICMGFLLLGVQGMAQEAGSDKYHPYAPAGIPKGAPRWMERLTDVENVNYYAMVDSFEHFKHTHPEMQRKTPMTKAVINYFGRWQRTYLPYVAKDGRIIMPPFSEFRKAVHAVNAKHLQLSKTRDAVATSRWEVLSPLRTYHRETKEMYPGQANVQRFDIARTNPNILYSGTETGMVFKTVDKGENWISCTPDFFFGGAIKAVEISQQNADKVLIAAGALLWLTTDGGATWKDITPQETGGATIRDAVFHPEDDNRMLVGTTKALYQTTDNGNSWTWKHDGECFDIKYKHGDANTIYIMVRDIYKVAILKVSTDGGSTFADRSPKLGYNLACGRIGLSEAPGGEDYIYIIACKTDMGDFSYRVSQYFGTPVLFKSKDGGLTWEHHDDIIKQMPTYEIHMGQGYYDMLISASSKDPEQVMFGMLDLYWSNDGGKTLIRKGGYSGQFNLHCDMQDIKVLGDDTWVSCDGGIIYSPDFFDKQAETRINGIYACEFWGFDQGWNEDVMVGGRYHNGDMAQMDKYNGASIHLGGGEAPTGYVLLSNPRKVAFSDTNPKNVILPDDWQGTFGSFSDFWTYPYEDIIDGMGLEFDPRYAKSFLLFKGFYDDETSVLWKTVDDGQNFVQLYKFPTPIRSHVISRSNPDKIVVSTSGNIFQSLDGGKSFKAYDNIPDGVRNAYKSKVAVHPRNENEIWVIASEPGQVYRTKDNGQTWEQLNKGLIFPNNNPEATQDNEPVTITRLFLTGNEKNAAYAIGSVSRPFGSEFGFMAPRGRVYYCDDTTDGWQDYSEGLPAVISLTRMLPFYKEGKIRMATNNGIWQRNLKDPEFRPIAQPLILNAGTSDNQGNVDMYFDSYSIVNQKDATWEWKFAPEPLSVSSKTVRNPVVRIAADQSYDVTLTVTTPQGSDTKTIKKMIVGKKDVPTSIAGQEVLAHDVVLSANTCPRGGTITLKPQGIDADCKWQLFSAGGKEVATQTVSATATTSISTNTLAPGMYFYLLTNKSFKKTGRLIIQ